MKKKGQILVISAIVLAVAVGGGVVLASRGEDKPVETQASTAVVEEVAVAQPTPVEEVQTLQPTVHAQPVEAEPEPEIPTAEENKSWFLAQVEANLRANPNVTARTDFAINYEGQKMCADKWVTRYGSYEDRAFLEKTASSFQKAFFENAACGRLVHTN